MIESRCGVVCSECDYREQFNCSGCVNIAVPAWGQCEVKICCENKKLQHCGECDTFPCMQLNQFAYDAEHGDNGLRIEQCKKWCAECNSTGKK